MHHPYPFNADSEPETIFAGVWIVLDTVDKQRYESSRQRGASYASSTCARASRCVHQYWLLLWYVAQLSHILIGQGDISDGLLGIPLVKNHGIPEEKILGAVRAGQEFFALPEETKFKVILTVAIMSIPHLTFTLIV